MSKKTELLKVFKEYKELYNGFQERYQAIDKNEELTPKGKEERKESALKAFVPTVALHHVRAVEIIDKGLEALESKWKKASVGKLSDGGYQAGLSNVIKMLEMGAIKEKEDIQNIIETYKEDFNALAMIGKILHNSKEKVALECEAMIPQDNRSKNKELLQKLRSNVDKYINVSSVTSVLNSFASITTDVALGMDSLSDFVTNKLGDDLELLS